MIFATAVLIATTTSTLLYVPNQASAQITPAPSILDSAGNGLGFIAQNTTDPLQNNTATNITQLASVLPTVDPVTATSFAPASEDSEESTSSSDDDDDDDDDSNSDSSNDDDSGDDDDDDDDNGDDDDDDNGDGNGGISVSVGGTSISVG